MFVKHKNNKSRCDNGVWHVLKYSIPNIQSSYFDWSSSSHLSYLNYLQLHDPISLICMKRFLLGNSCQNHRFPRQRKSNRVRRIFFAQLLKMWKIGFKITILLFIIKSCHRNAKGFANIFFYYGRGRIRHQTIVSWEITFFKFHKHKLSWYIVLPTCFY